MFELYVGIGRISLRIRHAQSLKDKRKVVQSLIQKMRNMGCSVTEAGDPDNLKMASLGVSFTGAEAPQVEERFSQVEKLLWGDFEVVAFEREVIEYTSTGERLFTESILDDRDPDDDDL